MLRCVLPQDGRTLTMKWESLVWWIGNPRRTAHLYLVRFVYIDQSVRLKGKPLSTCRVKLDPHVFLSLDRHPVCISSPSLTSCGCAPRTCASGHRWLNLWSPPDDKGLDLCDDDVKISDLDATVTVHNLALILIILVAVLFVHIIVVSAIEAFWLTMVRAGSVALRYVHGKL